MFTLFAINELILKSFKKVNNRGHNIGQFTRFCVVYVVLNTLDCLWTLNSMLYCILRIPNIFCFWHLNNLIARNQHYFCRTYENIYTFFSFVQFDSMKPIQLLKTYLGNSHDFVSCILYWIHLIVCERSILCCIVYFFFFFGHLNNLIARNQHYFCNFNAVYSNSVPHILLLLCRVHHKKCIEINCAYFYTIYCADHAQFLKIFTCG